MSTRFTEVSATIREARKSAGASSWMAGFFLLGVLLGMLGSLVIIWHYHIDVEPKSIGRHFLGMSAGFVFSAVLVPRLVPKTPVRIVGLCSAALAGAALIALSLVAPPAASEWRITALTVAGVAAGALNYSLFYANQAAFEKMPASAANRAGALFVGGGLLATIVAGFTYFGGSLNSQTAILAFVPGVYFILFFFHRFAPPTQRSFPASDDVLRDTLKDLRSIATMLFSLLLFFQFSCEWAVAGWLPLFLIHTLGLNPVTAIGGLGLYFLALMAGRLAAQMLLPIVNHRKMLLCSVASAMFGYLLLSFTQSTFLAGTLLAMLAAIIIGLSHAPIYPLIAERLDHRFSYHPGFYSGALSFAMAGAMATPWLLGYVAESFGMRMVMLIPALASIAVLVLSILIMLESRLMGGSRPDAHEGLLASDK